MAVQKLEERIQKLHAFNASSASIFSEYESCLAQLNTGISAIANSGAWNASSGTFDIAKMDMRWAKPITDNWKKREQRIKTAKAKEAKQKISKLDGYTIEVYELENGEKLFIIKKGEKIISRKSKPDLYDILDDYKDYLPKERVKVKKLKIMKFEAPLIVPVGKGIDLIGKIGQISQGLGKLRNW
ncbi:hypothetical protein [Enterococcus rivorum]|uniref:LXG domain-containing protein n=2 Tax=Enterococcus rivorum TaxID=762845 RepID=A0A1E5KX70_9ENTE|nr:hypothetical protein [Enterococcus rivorum]OEH82464.1 hypothetical protein BCR26_13300 [Enterococcus rivorum]